MNLLKSLLLTGVVAAAAAPAAVAGEIDFSYNPDGLDYYVYGFNKKETYDIAIKINDPMLVGCRVTGISVPVPAENEWLEGVCAWMSSELKLESKVNVADIATKEGVVENYSLDVTFDEPYVIPEEGVYVGYSFKVTTLDDYSNNPVAVVYGSDPDGLYIHSSRSRLKWSSIAASSGIVSSMVVRLDSDFGPSDAGVLVPEKTYVAVNEKSDVAITLINHGSEPLKSFSYSYAVGDHHGEGTMELSEPLAPNGRKTTTPVTIDPIPELGTYPFVLTIDKFNGVDNKDPYTTASGDIEVIPFLPVNRPLVEEFTGLNCGYCPRGFVAMEQMSHDYPELFVGMAYHGGSYERGCMATTSIYDWPVSITGFPSGTINRERVFDPSYFTSEWASYRNNMPVADVDVAIEWADEEQTRLNAKAVAKFIYDYKEAGYKLSLALVADGLTNPEWKQSNYFAGGRPDSNPDSPFWEPFINGGSYVEGLVFNDVVAYYKDVKGIEGSLPEDIKAGDELTYDYSINMADVKNDMGEYFINTGATVHMVAIILDADGKFVNCNKSASITVDNATGVESVGADSSVVEVVYYDLQGRMIQNPAEGIFVKVEKMSDGTERRSKVAL